MLKKTKKILIILLAFMILLLTILSFLAYINYIEIKEREEIQKKVSANTPEEMPEENKKINFFATEDSISVFNEIVYDGLTMDELANKLNKSLTSNLKSTGKIFAEVSLEMGVDPYLVVAISLYETGCKWRCSYLVRECNNVGGVKGTPYCEGTSFRKYDTLEIGITKFITNISKNYYKKGLTTAELMEDKYANGSNTWAGKVNNYISSIKSK